MSPQETTRQSNSTTVNAESIPAPLRSNLLCRADTRVCRHSKTLYSKKYGVHLARFTHHSQNVIYASTKEDGMNFIGVRCVLTGIDTLRYLSLHDNHYVRYFKGHKAQVVCLEISPTDEQFLSAGLDDTVRLWNMSSPNCQVPSNPKTTALIPGLSKHQITQSSRF